ncbi:hypothetical protein [Aurantimonas aggregata]
MLPLVALLIAYESFLRLTSPVPILFGRGFRWRVSGLR